MKSWLGLGLLGVAVVVASQACGSSDKARKARGDEGGAGGADSGVDLGGAPVTPAGGAGGSAGTTGAEPEGGSAGALGDGGTTGDAGGAGGEANEGGASGLGGAPGEGGAGGTGDEITCEVAPTCSQDLSDLGTGDFSISFKLTTTTSVASGLVSQRAICMHSMFWDVRLRDDVASISIETDDQVSYTSFTAPMEIADGDPHEVRICRKSGVIYAFADGTLRAQEVSLTSFGTLPTLASATTVCTSFGTSDLVGTLEDVCVGAL